MRVFVDLETKAKPRFLNHNNLRAWFLTDLEKGTIHELPEPLLYANRMQSIVIFNAALY